MKKRIFAILTICMVIISLSLSAFAHGGRTDSSGGHKDNKNKSGLGGYHYHCGGYPAHLHTCLFKAPEIVEYKQRYYEQSLIHRTIKGELVRSKSEVIIANMLHEAGIEYEYEKELNLGEDGIRIPDFTIQDAESGLCFYWEHCGMLGDAAYAKHWNEKKELYKKHGIVEGENLIVSQDSRNGGIDSAELKSLIEKYLI